MASQRYRRILESAKYFSAIDNYIKYITDSTKRGQRVGNGQARVASKKLYLIPFGRALATGQMVMVSGADPTWARVRTNGVLTDYVKETAPAQASNIVRLADFKAARITVVTGRRDEGTAKTSAVTGLKYLSYGGKSTSIPFGNTAVPIEEEVAFNNIRAALQTGNIFPGGRFSWIKEKP